MAGEAEAQPVLITLPLSHFCEKARWALQRYGIGYSEGGHAPLFHLWYVQGAGGKGSTPVLKLPGSSSGTGAGTGTCTGTGCVDGSTAILRWVDERIQAKSEALPRLFPADKDPEVARLCDLFDSKLGPSSRRWAYCHVLFTDACLASVTAPPVPTVESVVLRCGLWYIIRSKMAERMAINEEGKAKAMQQIKDVFSEVEGLLSDGRKYLTGPDFTAADLSFAALAAPVLGQKYACIKDYRERPLPPDMKQGIEEMRETKAGKFAIRLWEEDRGVVLS